MKSPEPERLKTRQEIADLYGISRRYLEVAACRGEGPPMIKIGRSVRYRPSDVVAWLDRLRVEPDLSLKEDQTHA